METRLNYSLFLVAEDDKLTKENFGDILERGGHRNVGIQTFKTKEACLKLLDVLMIKPDVIVLDHNLNKTLPGQHKFLHTTDQIKKISPLTHIIIISEEKDMPSAVKALKYGAQDYVMKDQFMAKNVAISVNEMFATISDLRFQLLNQRIL